MSSREAFASELAWADGRVVSRAELALPLGDAGFVLGATVTEQLRTIRGRLFLLDEHLARLQESLTIVGIVPPVSLAAIGAAASELAAHNHAVAVAARGGSTEPGPDLGLVVFVTPGDLAAQHEGQGGPPRVIVHTFPLAFRLWADAYDHGLALRTVTTRQVPDACWPVQAKVRSRLHYHLADREAHAAEPGARAVLEHLDGRISETSTANIAVVSNGAITVPPPADALGGVSLAFVRRLAERLVIPWRERSLRAVDLAAADEILLTSTPSCILPATRFDGRAVAAGKPGPVFSRLLATWSDDVGLDIAAQARHRRQPAVRS
jgi:branched-subunit amino acid aminotransferase/4-amino-4-deoxychorismate lyase